MKLQDLLNEENIIAGHKELKTLYKRIKKLQNESGNISKDIENYIKKYKKDEDFDTDIFYVREEPLDSMITSLNKAESLGRLLSK